MITIINKNDFPLISCLCVTRNRSELLKKSINLFLKQSYTNKEMIIIYYSDDKKTKEIALNNDNSNIFFYEHNVSDNKTLGDLRNLSIDKARGEFVCIWDDDDWYSNDRLFKQFAFIKQSGKDACTIRALTVYNCRTRGIKIGINRLDGWEPSLMCKRETIKNIGYDSLNIAEDVNVIKELYKRDLIHSITDETLYVYFIHRNNVSERRRLKDLERNSKELDDDMIKILKERAKDYIELHLEIYKRNRIKQLLNTFFNFFKQ